MPHLWRGHEQEHRLLRDRALPIPWPVLKTDTYPCWLRGVFLFFYDDDDKDDRVVNCLIRLSWTYAQTRTRMSGGDKTGAHEISIEWTMF